MKAKLFIVGLVSEEHIASFKSKSEAFHCGSLLQASTEDKNLHYYVEFKEKGMNKRQMVDSFTRRLPFLNKETTKALENHYKPVYLNLY